MFLKNEFIKHVSSIPRRGAASEGERKAANYIFNTMRNMGLRTSIEEFKTPTRMPVIHFVHFFMLFLASIASNWYPVISMFVGGLVVVSFWGEFTHRFFILRYLIPHLKSQNVIGKLGDDNASLKVIISAHMDAARTGIIFNPKISNIAGRFKHQPLHKLLMILMMVLLTVFVVKAFGGGTWVLSVIFNTVAVISLILSALMVQWQLAPFGPGANDDLSGVAVMLGLADKLKDALPLDFQFVFVTTGAEEAHCSGMKAYMNVHNRDFDREHSYFINLECLGGGRLKYVTEEGFIVFQKHDHTLIQIADIVARKYGIDFTPAYTVAHSESIVPLTMGFKSLGLIALNENQVPTNYHQPCDTEDNINYDLLDTAETAVLKMIEVMGEFERLEYI